MVYLLCRRKDMTDWADYYKERYDETREQVHEFHFAMGWINSTLKRLGEMIEQGDIKTDPYTMQKLKEMVHVVETAKEQAKLNTLRTNERIEELKTESAV